MENEYNEYEIFTTTTRAGEEVEMAITDRFVFEEKHYVVASLIKGDEICDDGCFVYRSIKAGDDIIIREIDDPEEYSKVAEYFSTLEA